MNAISVTVMYFLPVDAEQREDFWGEKMSKSFLPICPMILEQFAAVVV